MEIPQTTKTSSNRAAITQVVGLQRIDGSAERFGALVVRDDFLVVLLVFFGIVNSLWFNYTTFCKECIKNRGLAVDNLYFCR